MVIPTLKTCYFEASEDIITKFKSQALHIIKIKYWRASGSGNPPFLIPALRKIAFLGLKTGLWQSYTGISNRGWKNSRSYIINVELSIFKKRTCRRKRIRFAALFSFKYAFEKLFRPLCHTPDIPALYMRLSWIGPNARYSDEHFLLDESSGRAWLFHDKTGHAAA